MVVAMTKFRRTCHSQPAMHFTAWHVLTHELPICRQRSMALPQPCRTFVRHQLQAWLTNLPAFLTCSQPFWTIQPSAFFSMSLSDRRFGVGFGSCLASAARSKSGLASTSLMETSTACLTTWPTTS